MPHRTIEHDTCRKHGFILTCYVNGKKRFRAQAFVKPPAAFKIAPIAAPRSSDGHSGRAGIVGL